MLKVVKEENECFWLFLFEDFYVECCLLVFVDIVNSCFMKGGGGGGVFNVVGFLLCFVKLEGWVYLDLVVVYYGGVIFEMLVGVMVKGICLIV